MNVKKSLWLIAGCLTLALASPALAAETAEGTVGETGFGSFQLIDGTGTNRKFNQEKKTSKFEPADWRPATGDQIKLTYTEITKGSDKKVLRVDTATLVKAGPETVQITSPVEVVLTEVGKSGYKGKVGAEGKIVKFDKEKSTKVEPAGWLPAAGEKVKIEFHAKASSFTFGVGYEVVKIEKVVEDAKPPAAEAPKAQP